MEHLDREVEVEYMVELVYVGRIVNSVWMSRIDLRLVGGLAVDMAVHHNLDCIAAVGDCTDTEIVVTEHRNRLGVGFDSRMKLAVDNSVAVVDCSDLATGLDRNMVGLCCFLDSHKDCFDLFDHAARNFDLLVTDRSHRSSCWKTWLLNDLLCSGEEGES